MCQDCAPTNRAAAIRIEKQLLSRQDGVMLLRSGLLSLLVALPALPADKLQFNRDVRPVLSDNCFRCHGPDKGNRKARLRLDDRAAAIERGAFVPGKPEESELVTRIFSADPEERMPPSDSHKHLNQAQKELLKRWIAEGAEYQPHWAYIKPIRPALPEVNNRAWVRTPVDAFILKELEARNIQPSPEAERRTLLRRLSLDLLGLPPPPNQSEENAVERLLASPHYGERMAVSWLDAVRFADTVGYHGDQNQNIFPYRDYVIDAFNRNKPFDRFTIEQIAGDLLDNATDEQRIATGFNRLNMMTREGGAQPREYLAKYAADRVRTVATTWLGSTLACAECHDHKFDPFTAKDFYQMAAFFADVRQWGVYQDYPYTPNPDLKAWSNDHPFPPELEVESPYLQARKERFRRRINELLDQNVARESVAAWLPTARAFLREHPDGWVGPRPRLTHTNATVRHDSVIVFHARRAGGTNEIRLKPGAGTWSALRLELMPTDVHEGRILRPKAENRTIQISLKLSPSEGKERKVSFFHADATHREPTYSNGAENLGVEGGWKPSGQQLKSPQTAIYIFDELIKFGAEDNLVVTLRGSSVGAARLSVSPFAAPDPMLLLKVPELLGRHDRAREQADLFLFSAGRNPELVRERKRLQREWLECRGGRAPTLVTEPWKPMLTRVLPRGNWQDESGEIVEPGPPSFLLGGRASPRAYNRLDLAHWLVSRDNPLTARTMVNRLWKQFFGAGLCSTVDDLGLQGDTPSHPELLDWLAIEFIESGWDIKHMVRLMVNSSTYRQQSHLRPELRDIDPNNRLLASQNPRRLEAEFVRDNALAIAGLLDDDLGGPSVRPPQPADYYANLQFPDRDYEAHNDERRHRRGVYMHWQRTFLHPMLANFDASSREECTASRIVSNTPQQALTLLNDPCFVEAAGAFANSLLLKKASAAGRIAIAYERALGRPPKPSETQSLLRFLDQQRETAPQDARELYAWTQLCRVILNLHETISIY